MVVSTLPHPLSTSSTTTLNPDVGTVWDVGIEGVGYMISTLDQESPFEFRSYEIQAIQKAKPRIDDSEEPGEQTLFPWWSRAQHSWHEGAGQHVFDSPFSSRFRFCESRGLNIWETGQISLLKDTEELASGAITDYHLLSTPDALFYTHDGNLTRDPDPDATGETDEDTLATHSGTPVNSVASDGEVLYAAFSGGSLGIKSTPLEGTLAWSDVNDQTAVELIAFVKGRLIGAKGNNLYEYDLSTTDEPEPFNLSMPSAWQWNGITESGPAIYFSGVAGDRSEIFAARLTAQDIPFASTTTLGAMRSVWQAPEGETVHTIKGYLGQQVLIGTSKGVRIGTIATGDGDLEVSSLVTFGSHQGHGPNAGVKTIEPQEQYAWFGWTKFDGTYSGTGRIHLGEFTWASDVMFESQGEVLDITHYDGRVYFVLDEGVTQRIIKEHATDLEPEGWFRHCVIRFATTERKNLRYFDILTRGEGLWSLAVGADTEVVTPYTTDNPTGGFVEELISLRGSRFSLKVTLKRNPSDATDGPSGYEWRFRSEPKTTGRFRYLVPLMVYDFVETKQGREAGHPARAIELLNHLTDIYRTDEDFVFQGLETGLSENSAEPIVAKMEDLRFKEYAPPKGGRGFGGIALAILREVR